MLHLKAKKMRIFTLFAALFLIFPLFFIGNPTLYSSPLYKALWNLGHYAFFALAALLFLYGYRPLQKKSIVFLSLCAICVGGSVEVLQSHAGRDGNWQDVMRDLAGAWIAYFWFYKQVSFKWCGRGAAIVLSLPDIFFILYAAVAQGYAIYQFPQLASFESVVEQHGLKGNYVRSDNFYSQGKTALKVRLNTHKYSGISFNEFFNSWRGYSHLEFDIYNPQMNNVNLILRINDVQHAIGGNGIGDRFNHAVTVFNGWNHYSISIEQIENAPAARKMDLSKVESITLFAIDLPVEQDVYIDNLRLIE